MALRVLACKGWSLGTAARGRDAKDHGCVSRAPRRRGFCQAVWRWQRAEKKRQWMDTKDARQCHGLPATGVLSCAFFRVFSATGDHTLALALAAARPCRARGRDMRAARPPEGTHTAAEGEGAPVRAARPPEGPHPAAEGEGTPASRPLQPRRPLAQRGQSLARPAAGAARRHGFRTPRVGDIKCPRTPWPMTKPRTRTGPPTYAAPPPSATSFPSRASSPSLPPSRC